MLYTLELIYCFVGHIFSALFKFTLDMGMVDESIFTLVFLVSGDKLTSNSPASLVEACYRFLFFMYDEDIT